MFLQVEAEHNNWDSCRRKSGQRAKKIKKIHGKVDDKGGSH